MNRNSQLPLDILITHIFVWCNLVSRTFPFENPPNFKGTSPGDEVVFGVGWGWGVRGGEIMQADGSIRPAGLR